MQGRSRGIAGEQDEALSILLGSGRPATAPAQTSALGSGARETVSAASGAPAWLPWAALFGGTLVGVGCITGGMWVASAVAGMLWPSGNVVPALLDTLFTVAIFAPMLLLALLAGRMTRTPPLRAGRAPLPMLALGAVLGAGGVAIATVYAAFAGVARSGGGGEAGALVAAGSVVMLLQSGTEEVLLRGWVQPALASRWPAWVAVIVSAVIFAGLHVLGGARSPVTLVNMTLGGVMFGLLAWKTDGMTSPIAAHFAWNWSEALLLGLDPNPGVGSFGALVDLDLVGATTWGGSDEGLNGSLAMMVVLAALILPLGLWKPRES